MVMKDQVIAMKVVMVMVSLKLVEGSGDYSIRY